MDDATALLRQRMPLCATLGMRAASAQPSSVILEMPWDASRCTGAGLLHGGALMALADSAGALLAYLNLPEGASGTTTIESKTNFMRGVRDGVVRAESALLHAGSTTMVVETVLTHEGRLVAKVTQTQAVLRPRPA
ncbi:MAG: PaaI family thioesterase [Burkholderiaceae bacterium]